MWTQSLIYPLCDGRDWMGHPEALCGHLHEMKILYWRKPCKTPLPDSLPTCLQGSVQRVRVGIPANGSLWFCICWVSTQNKGSPKILLFRCLYFKVFLLCQTSVWVLALPTMSLWSNYCNCCNLLTWKKWVVRSSHQQFTEYESDFQTVKLPQMLLVIITGIIFQIFLST